MTPAVVPVVKSVIEEDGNNLMNKVVGCTPVCILDRHPMSDIENDGHTGWVSGRNGSGARGETA